MKRIAGIILIGSVFLAGCSSGSGGDNSSNTSASQASAHATVATHPDESAAAKAMLLTVTDFPAGWAEESKAAAKSPLDKCDAPPSAEKTGSAETGRFSSGNTDSVTESVSIFTTTAAVANALKPNQDSVDCFTKAVNGGELDDDSAKYSGASVSPLSFPALGDASAAYRVKFHVKAKGQTGFGSEGDAYVDVVSITKGRVGFTVTAFGVFTPFDTTMLQQFAQKAVAKVTAP